MPKRHSESRPFQTSGAPFVIKAPRIGSGGLQFAVGGVFLAIGVFGLLAGAGGVAGAESLGAGTFAIGALIIAAGFWVSLFRRVEERLIDIQEAIVTAKPAAIPQATAAPGEPETPPSAATEQDLMAKYGVTFDGQKYSFQEYKYDRAADAIEYAKKIFAK